MIIKVKKRLDPYARIDNRALTDERLSYRARGVLAYLLSKPNNWEVFTDDVIKRGQEGRDAVRAAFRELQTCGYAKLVNTRKGRQWIVCEQPEAIDGFSGHGPSPEKANVAFSGHIQTKEVVQTKETPQTPQGVLELNGEEEKGAKNIVEFAKMRQRVGALFNRKPTTKWSDKEQRRFKEICPLDDDELTMVERYYTEMRRKPDNHCRRDLYTFLNNYRGEVDRAYAYCQRHPLPGQRSVKTKPPVRIVTEEEFKRAGEVARAELEKFRKHLRHEE